MPETREQRDWVHKVANVLHALLMSVHPGSPSMFRFEPLLVTRNLR